LTACKFKHDEVATWTVAAPIFTSSILATKNLTQITQWRLRRRPSRLVPDGHLIAFASNRSKPDPDRTYNTDIWVVAANNIDKGAQLTQVTTNLVTTTPLPGHPTASSSPMSPSSTPISSNTPPITSPSLQPLTAKPASSPSLSTASTALLSRRQSVYFVRR